MIKNERGFSLFEMAIVLVIFGLVLASASSVLTLFVNRGGSEKTRQMMEANKNALVSFVQSNYQLPTTAVDNTAPFIDFQHNVTYPTDGYNTVFTYYADPILDKSIADWDLEDITDQVTVNSVCGASYTNTAIQICTNADCSASTTVANVAFLMISGGENRGVQTADSTAASGVRTYTVRTQDTAAVEFVDDEDRTAQYDDIVDWISLNELRSKVGCDGEYIKFTSHMMPAVKKNVAYSYNFYVEGGIPFKGNNNYPEYEWRFTDTDALGFTMTKRDNNDSQIGSSLTSGDSGWVQGHHLKISGNSALGKSQYRIKIDVRDQAGKESGSTGYTRTFILNAEQ